MSLIVTGALEIDPDHHRITRGGQPIRLTPTEWRLLIALLAQPNVVLDHSTLLRAAWGAGYSDESDYLHTYVRRLRLKLEDDPAQPRHLLTEMGIGYRWELLPPDRADTPETDPPTHKQTRLVNALPSHSSAHFVGRDAERVHLRRLLRERMPLIGVYGRAGIGKTALVSRVLADIVQEGVFDGIVSLSAADTGLTLERIFAEFDRLIGGTAAVWQEHAPATYKIGRLIDLLHDGAHVLLLDNLEPLQDPASGALTPPDLNTFLSAVLTRASGLSIIVTSRVALALPLADRARARQIDLHDGLDVEAGCALLRGCDPDNAAGLRDAPADLLRRIVTRLGGIPRLLEAVVGLLLTDPLLTPQDIITDPSLTANLMDAGILSAAFTRFDVPMRAALQGLAVYRQPVPLTALMKSVNGDEAGLRAALNRLLRAYAVRYDRAAALFSLHPLDQETVYAALPPEERRALHQRAADYYAGLVGAHPDDADAARAQAEHLLAAGEPDAAAQVMQRSVFTPFARQNRYAELLTLLPALTDRAAPTQRRGWLRSALAETYQRLGQFQAAADCIEQLLGAAADDAERSAALLRLGWVRYERGGSGSLESAREAWSAALSLYRTLNDRAGMGEAYSALGWVAYLRGDDGSATRDFERAIGLFDSLGDAERAAAAMGDLGEAYAQAGDLPRAVILLRRSLAGVVSRHDQSYKGTYLAAAFLRSGDLAGAAEAVEAALMHNVLLNQAAARALSGVIWWRMGRADAAQSAFRAAFTEAEDLLGDDERPHYRALYARALALAGLCAAGTGVTPDEVAAAYRAARHESIVMGHVPRAEYHLLCELSAYERLLPACAEIFDVNKETPA